MEQYRSARQFGVSVILFTVLFRLFEIGIPQALLKIRYPRIEKETGQIVRLFSSVRPFPVESAPPVEIPVRPVFTAADAGSAALINTGSEKPDVEALIAAPLHLTLDDGTPRVLILHTHTTESYAKAGEDYRELTAYRTLDEEYNMLSVGDRITRLLEAEGIRVIHDRELHDYPSYNGAYNHARKATQQNLQDHPGIQLVLDLHRDAADGKGGQLKTHASIGTEDSAQLMLVLGSGSAALAQPVWQENLALALKLQTLLERRNPGICRPLSLRPQRFNQDLSPGMLLVEVGGAGDSHRNALRAADALAQAIIELKNGSA